MSQVRRTHDLFLVFRHAHSIAYFSHTALEWCKQDENSKSKVLRILKTWMEYCEDPARSFEHLNFPTHLS